MDSKIQIRKATPSDAKAIRKIYEPYVLKTAITYEIDVPSEKEFQNRIARTLSKYPYIVAENSGEVVGYAYAGPFYERPAYDHSCELSIYMDVRFRGLGIGKALYAHLENLLIPMGITNLYACIAYPNVPDEYLDYGSVKFHEKLGFSIVGTFHDCANKFGRWYSMVWMEKFIGEHSSQCPPRPAPQR